MIMDFIFYMVPKKTSSRRKRSRPVIQQKFSPNMKMLGIIGIIVIGIIVVVAAMTLLNRNTDQTDSSLNNPIAVFNTTMGTFKIELYQDKMPKTCANFIRLSKDGFYNGMNFYRISNDFMIQAGRYFPDESEKFSPYGNIEFEVSDVKHVDGAISMASTAPGVGGTAEFFICDGVQSFLDEQYAAFGVTIEGLDVVHNIAAHPHDNSNPAGGGKPLTDIIISNITIIEA
jgi:peptidyl-prolyl cis-trans isomerase A (cyclophilin A)